MRNWRHAHPAIALLGNGTFQTPSEIDVGTGSNSMAVTSNRQLIGTLSNEGGGRFRGEFTWPVNPQSITVRSNFGGQAVRTVILR